jgi:hypothetical protein
MISPARAGWWFLTLPVLIEIVSPLGHSDIERSNRNIGHVRKAVAWFFSFLAVVRQQGYSAQ